MSWNEIFTSLRFRVAVLSAALFFLSSILCFSALFLTIRRASMDAIEKGLADAADEVLCVYLTGQKTRHIGQQLDPGELPEAVRTSVYRMKKDFQIIFAFRTFSPERTYYTIIGVSNHQLFRICMGWEGNLISSRYQNPARNIPELRKAFPGWQIFQETGIFYRLTSPKGGTLAGADAPSVKTVMENPGTKYKVLQYRLYNDHVIECAVSLKYFYHRQNRFIYIFCLIFLTLLPVGCAAGWLVSAFLTRGITRVRRAALQIAAGDLSKRVPERGIPEGELADLVNAFNTMSDHNERLVTELRSVTDDIAHDLRTPLTRICGTAELAVMKCSRPECREAFGSIAEECTSMIGLIGDMLEISRSEAGLRKPEKSVLDLSALFRETFELYRPAAEELGQIWELFIGEENIMISADRVKLQRILCNLLDNAAKFMQEGGHLTLDLRMDGPDHVRFSVADTGPGIPDDCKEKVFKRFFRMDSSRTTQGNGLGLAMVAAMVHLHNGSIRVEDTPGGGATFVVRLPVKEPGKKI